MIKFGPETLQDFDAALEREWLDTNGLGGFASSTVIGLSTRRYHGLLVAATRPPVGRMLLLAKLEETLVVNGARFELSANRYRGIVSSQGFRFLHEFRLDPFPIFTYLINGIRLEKCVFLVHGENTAVVQYELVNPLESGSRIDLEIRPLVAFRDYHATTHENPVLDRTVLVEPGMASFKPYEDLPMLRFMHDAAEIQVQGYWYRVFEYEAERERGLDSVEDLFNPFTLMFDLGRKKRCSIIASTEVGRSVNRAPIYRRAEIDRRRRVASTAARTLVALPAQSRLDDLVRVLHAAADHYLVARGAQRSVIAGYPWFTDWGRDAMIALPGLTLVAGNPEAAKDVIGAFVEHVDQGMIPSHFPDQGEALEYNAADATLWLFEAVRALLDYTHDEEYVRAHLYDLFADIIDWHIRGTHHGIHMEPDGLLMTAADIPLTWMDARVDGRAVTLRRGKPVELQALWYNALRIMEGLGRRFGHPGVEKRCRDLAERTRRSFREQFWNADAGCLYDVVDGDQRDSSLRPNQILAASLTHSMLGVDQAKRVVEVVEQALLTPFGLRSLEANDPRYCPRYEGDPRRRDLAYHQGTVWAWLLGPFITAYVKVHAGSVPARRQCESWLSGLRPHLTEAGLGHVSEIFDGDPPHLPRGCIAQAWSVGEILRAAVEDVLGLRPGGYSRLPLEEVGERPSFTGPLSFRLSSSKRDH